MERGAAGMQHSGCTRAAAACRRRLLLTLAHELLAQHVARLEGHVAAHGCRRGRRARTQERLEGARCRGTLMSVTGWRGVSTWCGWLPPAPNLLAKLRLGSPDRKPFHVKDSSAVEASTTPPMMGSRVSTTGRLGLSPRNSADRSTAAEEERGGSWGLRAGSGGKLKCERGVDDASAQQDSGCLGAQLAPLVQLPARPPTREHGFQRLDGVREGDSHSAQADVGQRVAQRVHHSQRGDRHSLRAGGRAWLVQG